MRYRLLFVFIFAAAAFPQQAHDSGFYQSPGTAKMEARLRKIYAQNDWKADPNKPAERIPYYRALLKDNLTPVQQFTVRMEIGKELLRAGDSAASVDELEQLGQFIRQNNIPLQPAVETDWHKSLAIAYLRLGEQENCNDTCTYRCPASSPSKAPVCTSVPGERRARCVS